PATPHIEKHFTAGDAVRDVVIGMSDGLTVPFALAAGLTRAISSSRLIVTAGFAENWGGGPLDGPGGRPAGRGGGGDYHGGERAREEREVVTMPEAEAREVREIFQTYGLTAAESSSVVEALRKRPRDWVNFMMRFELGLEEPDRSRAWKSALTIAGAYALGGIIPLAAYLILPDAHQALKVSALVTLIALAIFGAVKGHFTGAPLLRSALQTMLIGSLAAAAAFGIARWIS